jgi:hypothetical protein
MEYVASGCTHLRINDKRILNEDILPDFKQIIKQVNTSTKWSSFSLLFNAYTEQRLGETIFNNFSDVLYDVHSDSGGLQIITQGKTVTEEDKLKIYGIQRSLSTIAMSFDEIPLKLLSARSSVTDLAGRCIDFTNFKDYAKESGINLNNQLDYFRIHKDEYSHITKPLLIIHGNDMSSFQLWIDIVMNEIDSHNVGYISGLAITDSSIGFGEFEYLQLAGISYFLDIPKEIPKKYHILGVGSLKRMQPFLVLNSMFDNKYKVSYDSTTHTSSINFGRYMTSEGKNIDARRNANHVYKRIYDECMDTFKFLDIDEDKFILAVQSNKKQYEDKYNDDWYNFFISRLVYPINQINTFIKKLDMMKTDLINKNYSKFDDIQVKMIGCTDLKDFNEYLGYAKSHMRSKRIKNCESNSLNDLDFGF